MEGNPQPGEVWMEADGCLLCRTYEGDWMNFGASNRVQDDDPRIAHPMTKLLNANGSMAGTFIPEGMKPMEDRDFNKIGYALQYWVDNTFDPDSVLFYAGNIGYTPRSILAGFQAKEESVTRFIESALRSTSVDDFCAQFRNAEYPEFYLLL